MKTRKTAVSSDTQQQTEIRPAGTLREKHEFIPSDVPPKPGVYIFRDRFRTVIYVGKAVNLRRRLSSYFQASRLKTADPKLASLIHSISYWEYFIVHNEDESLILESRLIKQYAPQYNILMRDDKRYLLLKLDLQDRFPTLTTVRLKKSDTARYWGPFPKGMALKNTVEFLLARFKLRSCKHDMPDEETRKHCLKRMVRDCCEPCTGKCSHAEYMLKVDEMLKVLNGEIAPLTAELRERMLKYAAEKKFELAAKTRDSIENLESVFGRKARSFERLSIASPRQPGEVELVELMQALALPVLPRRIEGFDISNIMGTLAVASMVVAIDGIPTPTEYRQFRIKSVTGSNDFAMMREAVYRRYLRRKEEGAELPDLILIDGGKGQLGYALEALQKLDLGDIPLASLAKREEMIFRPGREEGILLDRHSGALRILQRLRDESHRFAVTFHRDLRRKRLETSLLDDIPGIGKSRKLSLLREFGSVRKIKDAGPVEIARRVPGIGENFAEKIYEYLVSH